MTRKEFDTWMADYCAAFPETGAWLNNSPDVTTTLRHWQTALMAVDLTDALEVTQRMLRGDDESVKAYEREQTPAHVKRLCLRQADRRRFGASQDDSAPEYISSRSDDFEMSPLLKRMRDAAAEGMTKEDISRHILPVVPFEKQNRYRCLKCRDVGVLAVWHPASMHAVLDGTFGPPRTRSEIFVACTCTAANKFHWALPFNEKQMVPCPRGPMDDEHANELRYRMEKMAVATSVQEFDAESFGAQEF